MWNNCFKWKGNINWGDYDPERIFGTRNFNIDWRGIRGGGQKAYVRIRYRKSRPCLKSWKLVKQSHQVQRGHWYGLSELDGAFNWIAERVSLWIDQSKEESYGIYLGE